MSDWTAGYVADIGYTFGYYTELNPLRVKLAFQNVGLVCPDIGTACELGFGQGLSANIHAAAAVTQWHGTDFNPSQAAFAQELARTAGCPAHLFDQGFDEFCTRDDLPEFDYIGLHGIWSWISDANRAVIVDFVRRKLKVGGVLYISYNTQPGWASMVPMRDLLTEHSEVLGAVGSGIVPRIDAALDFAERLMGTNPLFGRANPHVAERIKLIKTQNRNYVAHEYFNRDWLPMSFSRMAEWLAPAKLNFACSAHYLDHIDTINLTADQQTLLNEIPDSMFRQSVRDFMVNQPFRRDYWVKGARRLIPFQQNEALRAQRVLLLSNRADVSLTVKGALGDATMSAVVYDPILDFLANHKIVTLDQIAQAVKGHPIQFAQLLQAMMILIGNGHVAPVQDDATISKAKKYCDRLNHFVLDRAKGSGDIGHLASPVTGGGYALARFQQLFVLAMRAGRKQPDELAGAAWSVLSQQKQNIIKEGKELLTAEENLAELSKQATDFVEKVIPVLKAIQII